MIGTVFVRSFRFFWDSVHFQPGVRKKGGKGIFFDFTVVLWLSTNENIYSTVLANLIVFRRAELNISFLMQGHS